MITKDMVELRYPLKAKWPNMETETKASIIPTSGVRSTFIPFYCIIFEVSQLMIKASLKR